MNKSLGEPFPLCLSFSNGSLFRGPPGFKVETFVENKKAHFDCGYFGPKTELIKWIFNIFKILIITE